MFGLAEVTEVRQAMARLAAGFDPALVSATEAARVVEEAAAMENMAATVKALAAQRTAGTEVWRRGGDRSPAHHLARVSGTSVGQARQALDTAARLGQLGALEAAARAGKVSPAQAGPIAEAASVAPEAERRLVAAAASLSLGELRDACERTKAAAGGDGAGRHAAIHAARSLRRRRCPEGAGELTYRSTLEEVAEIYAVVQGFADRRFRTARAAGRREAAEAYLADGLLDAVRAAVARPAGRAGSAAGPADGAPAAGAARAPHGGPAPATGGPDRSRPPGTAEPPAAGSAPAADQAGAGGAAAAAAAAPAAPAAPTANTVAPRPLDEGPAPPPARPADEGPAPPVPAKVVVRIDWDALVRGWPVGDEVCEIAGLGPVAVSAVRAMIGSGDAFLAAVVTRGVDVARVAHLGRRATAHQRSALEWLNPTCTAEGCSATVGLEIDHRLDWARTRVTLLAWLDRPCAHHHDLKTNHGWAFVEGTGKRAMVPPDDPRHPRHGGRSAGAA